MKNRIHDWRRAKWPATVTFVYYALLSLFTGFTEGGETAFFTVLALCFIADLFAYACYCFFLSRKEENVKKLWFAFGLTYLAFSVPQFELMLGKV